MHTFDPFRVSSDLPGVNPATLNGMILYCCLMTRWRGLGTELSPMGLSQIESCFLLLIAGDQLKG
jgi:hypothetical protein